MTPNPPLGVLLHAIGGLMSAIFYLPYRKVKFWAWESYWIAGGTFSWIIAPWVIASLAVPNLLTTLSQAPRKSVFWSYLFGMLWGIGGAMFGLTVRYLGFALGTAMALGYCAAFGTLLPAVFNGEFSGLNAEFFRQAARNFEALISTTSPDRSGLVVMGGVVTCLVGIVISGIAGVFKERELPDQQKKASIKEFNFKKGIWVATVCGIMSACMSYGFAAGKPIANLAAANGAPELWKNLPVLIVVLAGGFTTNLIWCLTLNIRNKTIGDYFKTERVENTGNLTTKSLDDSSGDIPSSPSELRTNASVKEQSPTAVRESRLITSRPAASPAPTRTPVPILANYLLCAIGGTLWYLQFFFYGMGTTKMGRYDFSSWTLHMASIMIFGTLVGLALSEWKGVSRKTTWTMILGLLVLISSTVVIGRGNQLAAQSAAPPVEAPNAKHN
jgi:L-rhamnose-H+ transport protein